MQLETKLLKANEEISSQKLIIDLLMDSKQSKLATQPQQVNLKPGNIHRSIRIPCHSDCSIRPKTFTSPDTSKYERYSIPTTNRYEVLSTYPDYPCGDFSQAVHQDTTNKDFSTCKCSRRSKRLKLKTKTFSASRTKATSSKLSDYHDLEIRELDQEIHTVPT